MKITASEIVQSLIITIGSTLVLYLITWFLESESWTYILPLAPFFALLVFIACIVYSLNKPQYSFDERINKFEIDDDGRFIDTTCAIVKPNKSGPLFIRHTYWWSGTGCADKPILEQGNGVELLLPSAPANCDSDTEFFLYASKVQPKRGIEYEISQSMVESNTEILPFYDFQVSLPCKKLIQSVTFSGNMQPKPGSIHGVEMRMGIFWKRTEWIVTKRSIELVHQEESNTWDMIIKRPKLNHRYTIKWEWA